MKRQIISLIATTVLIAAIGVTSSIFAQGQNANVTPPNNADLKLKQQSCVNACMKDKTVITTEQLGENKNPGQRKAEVSFSEDILPLLNWRCSGCHQPGGAGFEKSGVDLTSYDGVMKGTKFGPVVIPGDPESSNLMMLVDWRVKPEIHMPYGKKQLSFCDRSAIREWILKGAKNN